VARLLIMTSQHLRHKFFCNLLGRQHEIVGVVSEVKGVLQHSMQVDKHPLVVDHFDAREEKEEQYFGSKNRTFNVDGGLVRSVPFDGVNNADIFEIVTSIDPDYIILFGTAIVRNHLLSSYEGRVINMHLGLSPYYRGSGTNFWPLANREPQCVGVTIHFATPKVDAGDILAQVRPNVTNADSCHDFGCKAIIKGSEVMSTAIKLLDAGQIRAVMQKEGGRLFRSKDFTVEALSTMHRNFGEGMVEEYLQNKERRDSAFPIVELQ
jgi:methionyl-tRNA formyltransferase